MDCRSQVLSKQNPVCLVILAYLHTGTHAHARACTQCIVFTPITPIPIKKLQHSFCFLSLSIVIGPITDSAKSHTHCSWYVYLFNQSHLYNHIITAALTLMYAAFTPPLFPLSCQVPLTGESSPHATCALPAHPEPPLCGHPPHSAWRPVPWAPCSPVMPSSFHLSSESSAQTAPVGTETSLPCVGCEPHHRLPPIGQPPRWAPEPALSAWSKRQSQ